MRQEIYKTGRSFRKHVCGNAKFQAMFIDVRTVGDKYTEADVPWDETGDIMTKNTPL